jgi:hypothetical protein
MSMTYGHGLMDGDKHLESKVRAFKSVRPLILPGGALVNHFPFCANSNFIPAPLVVLNSYFQYGTFLHGYHTSATNHWHEQLGS